MRQPANQTNIPIVKPQRPAPDECCGGGSCCPCVWDEYRDALKEWRQTQEHINVVPNK